MLPAAAAETYLVHTIVLLPALPRVFRMGLGKFAENCVLGHHFLVLG